MTGRLAQHVLRHVIYFTQWTHFFLPPTGGLASVRAAGWFTMLRVWFFSLSQWLADLLHGNTRPPGRSLPALLESWFPNGDAAPRSHPGGRDHKPPMVSAPFAYRRV